MRFALLGNHPDGLALTRALLSSGHHLLYHAGPPPPEPGRTGWPGGVRQVQDIEEVLADPAVELVVVASRLSLRPAHLRRALQSERHAVCVHPADVTPDAAYEAGMIQQDVRQLLLPLLAGSFHPGIQRLRSLAGADEVRLVSLEVAASGEVLLEADDPDRKACFPGWDVLRAVGGEIAEVAAVTPGEDAEPGTPIVVAGRFEKQGLFQMTLLPGQREPRVRLRLVGRQHERELLFPLGVPGPAFLSWQEDGELREEAWDAFDPWPALAGVIEEALDEGGPAVSLAPPAPAPSEAIVAGEAVRGVTPAATAVIAGRPARRLPASPRLGWQDAIRAHELDDAARRSAGKKKISVLEYPDASEDVTFKGTMTLVGCALLWAIILLTILSRWVPWLGWAVAPVLVLFLALQLLRGFIPPRDSARRE